MFMLPLFVHNNMFTNLNLGYHAVREHYQLTIVLAITFINQLLHFNLDVFSVQLMLDVFNV